MLSAALAITVNVTNMFPALPSLSSASPGETVLPNLSRQAWVRLGESWPFTQGLAELGFHPRCP